jgi:hypothetical protein
MKKITYRYKDGYRIYWRLEIVMAELPPTTDNNTDPDCWWQYRLINEDSGTIVMQDDFLGQYDQEPTLNNVLLAIQTRFTALALGLAKYAYKL